MKTIQQLKNWLMDASFSKKLFVSYLAIILVFLGLAVSINYYKTAEFTEQQETYAHQQTLAQTASFVGYKASAIKNIIDIISYDDKIQEIITTNESYYRKDMGNWVIQTTTVRNILFNTYTTPDITSVRLYMDEGPAAIEETEEFQSMTTAEKASWYQRLEESRDTYLWMPQIPFEEQGEAQISFIKKIANASRMNDFIGIIKADVPQSVLDEIVAQAVTTPDTEVLIFNSFGEVVATSHTEQAVTPQQLQQLLDGGSMAADGEIRQVDLAGETWLAGVRQVPGTDWNIAMLVPRTDVLTAATLYRNQMYLVVLALLVCAIPIAYFTSRSITNRLRWLGGRMQLASTGDFSHIEGRAGKDEIGRLTQTFNDMLTHITELLEEQYRLGHEIRNLELRVLQSQINPHFLYNTLDMLHWLGIRHHTPDVAEASDALARFYKLSLGHGEDVVTIQSELDHVAAYVEIQNMRFGHRIHLDIRVPEMLRGCPVLKILLQPLVENAIQHGIRETENEEGSIVIDGHVEQEAVVLSVEDDGVGMEPSQVEKLLQEERDPEKSGYGVINIHKRLQLRYGDAYGLHYTSTPGRGTRVEIRFPMEKAAGTAS